MNATRTLMTGLGLGALFMYLYDPNSGRRRRAITRDKFMSTVKQTGRAMDVTGRDLRQRARGMAAEARQQFQGEEQISDDVLNARIRSRIGRAISHPHAISVRCDKGQVTLSGPVLQNELDQLISACESVAGVKQCINQCEVHLDAGDIPSLQGGIRREGNRFELMQSNWSPTARLVMGALGGALSLWGMRRKTLLGTTLSTLGVGILSRGITNREFSEMFGMPGKRGFQVQKTLDINAPVEQVYDFWTHFDNFPRFMGHLREVRDLGGGRSRWVAIGPGGLSFEWDATIVKMQPNELISWKSLENSIVTNSGQIRFEPVGDNKCRLQIQMTYYPPGGMIGHLIAELFGDDPKHAMDADLIRMKSLFEEGKTHARGERITRESILQQSGVSGSPRGQFFSS